VDNFTDFNGMPSTTLLALKSELLAPQNHGLFVTTSKPYYPKITGKYLEIIEICGIIY